MISCIYELIQSFLARIFDFHNLKFYIQRVKKHKWKWTQLFAILIGLIDRSNGLSTIGSPKIEISHATKFQNGKSHKVSIDRREFKIHFDRE